MLAKIFRGAPHISTPAAERGTNMSSPDPFRIEADILRRYTETVFERIGVPHEDAKISADVLIEADLTGHDSHGVGRLFPCFNRIRKGLIETKPEITIEWITPTTGICDGGNGLGMVVGWRAMKACISRAEQFGSAFLTVNRSNHFGTAGYYTSMAMQADMIGIAMTNASPRVVPTRGTTGILGTNPISVAVPSKKSIPFLLDMSTSTVSSGRLDVAVRQGAKIPSNWVYPSVKPFLDADGVVPMAVLQYPLGGEEESGGYKGYGLALMVDLLCGVLSGANSGSRLASSKTAAEANIGHFFGAMKIAGFRPVDAFEKDYAALVRDVTSSPLERGAEKILIPGEPEVLARQERLERGIPVLPPVVRKLEEVARQLGISFPE
jgi:L-2-hydroxycarboxylate dehydrogenase (NAD+)